MNSGIFKKGNGNLILCIGSARIGINICEDIWFADGPVRTQVQQGGAHIILNLNASPYHVGKTRTRLRLLANRAKEHRVFVGYTNMVGGQDELVFDGNSFVVDPRGQTSWLARKRLRKIFCSADIHISQCSS